MKAQELLNGDIRIELDAPEKEKRVMVPLSRLESFEKDLEEIARHYEDSSTYNALRRVWAAWEKFSGRRRR